MSTTLGPINLFEFETLAKERLKVAPDDDRFEELTTAQFRRYVVERCIYGVDLDPLAVELCQLSLWIETMDPAFQLAFLAHKIKCGNSLVGSAHLITKVYFPRLIVPAAAKLAGLVDFVLAFGLLIVLMLYYRVPLTTQVLFLPVLVLLTALFGLGVGTWMSALNVKYRDVRFALPFLIQLWLFVSSVILPSSSVPAKWRWVLMFNPMSGIIEGYRAALFGLPFDWPALGVATVLTIAMLFYSVYSFGKAERTFADII